MICTDHSEMRMFVCTSAVDMGGETSCPSRTSVNPASLIALHQELDTFCTIWLRSPQEVKKPQIFEMRFA